MDDKTNAQIRNIVERAKTSPRALMDSGDEITTADGRVALNVAAQDAFLPEHLKRCGCPPRIIDVISAAGRLTDTDAVLMTRGWVAGKTSTLLLLGPPGTGKTVAACATLKLARKDVWFMGVGEDRVLKSWGYSPRRGMFARAAELSNLAPWAPDGRGKWERAREVEWLVLDDLGVERMDPAGVWAEQLDLLIDCRYGANLRTTMTSNLTTAEFASRYGDRIARRISDSGAIHLCRK